MVLDVVNGVNKINKLRRSLIAFFDFISVISRPFGWPTT